MSIDQNVHIDNVYIFSLCGIKFTNSIHWPNQIRCIWDWNRFRIGFINTLQTRKIIHPNWEPPFFSNLNNLYHVRAFCNYVSINYTKNIARHKKILWILYTSTDASTDGSPGAVHTSVSRSVSTDATSKLWDRSCRSYLFI